MSNHVPKHLPQKATRATIVVLWFLWSLFGFRIWAQWTQAGDPVDFLPGYDEWHSGTLSYEVLLRAQLVLLGVLGIVTMLLTIGRIRPRPQVGALLLSVGSLYFSIMFFRLGAALTFAHSHPFMGKEVPAFFHLILSAWLLALGSYHYRQSNRNTESLQVSRIMVRWLTYPMLISLGLWLHYTLGWLGLGLQWSVYVPVGLGAVTISLMERRYPYRETWKPDHEDVKSDLTFMVLVQVLLPKILAFFVAISVLKWLHAHGIVLDLWWPHHWAPIVQASVMLIMADFLRYWLHRASHEWSPKLWRLHAVHHSPHKLYWVNVGRFHPIEKALQFLCDALPFILLGVSADVLAVYFVFYAINGFFQHCNIDLRLGWLNYLISGPELHRWHHSWESRESNKNYGNNIIIWDLLFGSYFLPKDRSVEQLGLRNRRYPLDFLHQMRTPFVKDLDQTEK